MLFRRETCVEQDILGCAMRKTNTIQKRKGGENSPRPGIILAITLLSSIATLTTCGVPPKSGAILPPTWLPTTTHIQVVTLEEARQRAGFHLLEPTYLADNVRLVTITQIDNAFELEYRNPTQTENKEGFVLIRIRQTPLNYPPSVPTLSATPNLGRETIIVRGVRALVNRDFPLPSNITSEAFGQTYNSIEWIENGVGINIIGSLRVDELKNIVESMR